MGKVKKKGAAIDELIVRGREVDKDDWATIMVDAARATPMEEFGQLKPYMRTLEDFPITIDLNRTPLNELGRPSPIEDTGPLAYDLKAQADGAAMVHDALIHPPEDSQPLVMFPFPSNINYVFEGSNEPESITLDGADRWVNQSGVIPEIP